MSAAVRDILDRSGSRLLWAVDAWFRAWGLGALAALVATSVMLGLHLADWRVPFVIAHLSALSALAPLGFALVGIALARYGRAGGSFGGAVRGLLTHDRLVTALVLASFVTAAVSLSQFQGGLRWLRAVANYSTVSIVVFLVWRYLRAVDRAGR